jgi:hypothetical protein
MSKPYFQMTPAERLADRIAKNREIDQRVDNKRPAEIVSRQTAVRGVLDKFQQIKNTQGIDAASDFVLSQVKK